MDSVLPLKKAKPPLRPGSIPKIVMRNAKLIEKKHKPRAKPGKDSLQIATPDEAWFDARLDLVGINRHQLSIEFDPGSKNWFQKIVKGDRRCQISEVVWLANRLRVSGADIIRALGYDMPGSFVPIVGTVDEDSRVTMLPANQQEKTLAPPSAEAHTVALSCKISRGPLKFLNAQILFLSPLERTVQLGAVGRLAVFEAKGDPRRYVGITERAGISGPISVTLLTGQVVQIKELVAATPVEWTKTI